MNIKERIDLINNLKTNQTQSEIRLNSNIDVSDIFVRVDAVERILKNALNADKNILILSTKHVDKLVSSNYVSSFINQTTSIETFQNISENLQYITAEKVVVPEVSIIDFVKILEVLFQCSSNFIMNINLKSFNNVLETLRVLIALSFPNLTQSNVEHLISSANLLFVFVDRNDDGLFEISNISKIVPDNNNSLLENLYSSRDKSLETTISNEESITIENIPASFDIEKTVETKTVEATKEDNNDLITVSSPVSEITLDVLPKSQEQAENTLKINKYKLLKEKVKNRKHRGD